MADDRYFIHAEFGDVAVAGLAENGQIEDLLTVKRDGNPAVGDIWSAKIDRKLAKRAGDKPGAFASAAKAKFFVIDAARNQPGEAALLRVVRPADPAMRKVPAATTVIELAGAFLTATPHAAGVNISRKITDLDERERLRAAVCVFAAKTGFVVRTSAEGVDADILQSEAQILADAWDALATASKYPPRILLRGANIVAQAQAAWRAPPRRENRAMLVNALTAAISPRLSLGEPLNGAWIAFTRAPGAIVIDVNAAAASSALAVNLAAATAIPRALRLRGWSGPVVVDFVGAAQDDRKRIEAVIARNAGSDLALYGWGPAGLFEAGRRSGRTPIETIIRAELLREEGYNG